MPNMILSRRAKIALSVVAILIVLIVLIVKLSGTYVDLLWFREVGAAGVFSTVFWTRLSLFGIFGALMALIIAGNLAIAYTTRPPFRPMSPEQQNLQNYVQMVEPRRRLIVTVVAVIAFLAAGASAQGDWAAWQVWLHGASFGTRDPQFHLDVSFYAWDLPVYRLMLGFGFTALIFAIILVVGTQYLTGAIRLQTPGPKITIAARRHLTILIFVFMLLKAVAYWFDRYSLVFSERSGKFTGASYTDVHAALPAKTILFWITLILAAAVLASLWLRSALLPGIGFIVLIVLSILMGGIYPAIVQQVSVKPNASTKEAEYIGRNIDATRSAYGIVTKAGAPRRHSAGTVTYQDYQASATPNVKNVTTTDPSVSNLRVLDPNVLSPTFTQLQALRNQYGFNTKLDVDRYTVDGDKHDYIVGVRELRAANLTGDQTNWINEHTNYTHGYGFVAATASKGVATTGDFADGGIPQTGSLNSAVTLKRPQAYYGELLPDYAIVGGKGAPREFDGTGNAKITYAGKGGIPLSSPFTKLAFALDEHETNFLLNDAVGADGAKAIINRDPRERVKKMAPFLNVDSDPYPFVDPQSGHMVWMVDAYTTTANYPYSERRSLSDLTNDSLTQSRRNPGQADQQVNYIRNSVKATVDAYDGTVKLYQWDSKDPVLKTWMNVFPNLISKKSQMPASVREHVRYPEDLFEVQRGLLEEYHVDNPTTFYNQSDKWRVPLDPTADAGDQPPYYVLASPQTGRGNGAEFQVTSPMQVNSDRNFNLAAYVAVNSDPDDYGQMTILRVPTDRNIQGPRQVANAFQNSRKITDFRTGVSRGGSSVVRGNLLTLPVGNSFLYAQPLYVQAEGASGYPLLSAVELSYGNKVGFGDSLAAALADLRSGGTTADTSDPGGGSGSSGSSTPTGSGAGSGSSTPTTPTTTPPSTPAGGSIGSAPASGSVDTLLTRYDQAQTALDDAYASKDQARIGKAQADFNKAASALAAAVGRSISPGGSSSPGR